MGEPEGKTDAKASDTPIESNLLARLTPKALAVLIGIGLFLLSGVILWALNQNKPINVWGITIGESTKPDTSKTTALETQIQQLKDDKEELKNQLAAALKPVDLARVLPPGMSKEEMLNFIQDLKRRAAELDKLEQSPVFVFSKLERVIDEYGGSINTSIKNGKRKDAYRLIQLSLQAINAFAQDPNGNQAATYQALIAFQKTYNRNVSEEHRGFFGPSTLAAVRARFRAITDQ